MTDMRLDKHAYRGAPRRIGSSWSAVESNPPSEHAFADWQREHNWSWRRQRRSPKPRKSAAQQAADLLTKLLGK